jgi:hypothetical protein
MEDKNKILEYFDTIDEPEDFKIILKKNLKIFLDKSETDYICGKRKEILFTDEELQDIFIETDKELTENAFDSLIKKDLLSMYVNEEGELAYTLSNLGFLIGEKIYKESL